VKRENSAFVHLKCYEIDGHLLRTGSANFSASGEKRQDNDLIVLKDAQAAAKFKHAFEGTVCERRSHFARRKQLTYKRPFPAARYCVQSGRTSIGRPPHSLHLRCPRSAGISIEFGQPKASTTASRPHPHFTSIDVMPDARILPRVIAGPLYESRMTHYSLPPPQLARRFRILDQRTKPVWRVMA